MALVTCLCGANRSRGRFCFERGVRSHTDEKHSDFKISELAARTRPKRPDGSWDGQRHA
jgi:hypothetical protein